MGKTVLFMVGGTAIASFLVFVMTTIASLIVIPFAQVLGLSSERTGEIILTGVICLYVPFIVLFQFLVRSWSMWSRLIGFVFLPVAIWFIGARAAPIAVLIALTLIMAPLAYQFLVVTRERSPPSPRL